MEGNIPPEKKPPGKRILNFLKGKLSYLSKSGDYSRHPNAYDNQFGNDIENLVPDIDLATKDFLILLCKSLHM
jgi:hypothetical protein